jgi:hypothetical protein
MNASGPQQASSARQARVVAVVIAVTVLVWLGAQWLGKRQGWDASYAFLFDLAAIAAFVWALIVTWGLWRRQRLGSAGRN